MTAYSRPCPYVIGDIVLLDQVKCSSEVSGVDVADAKCMFETGVTICGIQPVEVPGGVIYSLDFLEVPYIIGDTSVKTLLNTTSIQVEKVTSKKMTRDGNGNLVRVEYSDQGIEVTKTTPLEPKKFYFTFGFGHVHENCYTVIEALDIGHAKALMYANWGNNWSMVYESAEAAGVEKYNLREVPT